MTPLPSRTSQRPARDSENSPADAHPPSESAIQAIVDIKAPIPIPMGGNNAAPVGEDEDAEPIVIVDDSDPLEAPVAKKRRLVVDTSTARPGTI
jgi:hypothetical protein